MRQRLARLGVTDVGVIAPSDPATELAAVAGALRGRTMLVDADLIVADACLGQLIDDPAVRSGALVVDALTLGWDAARAGDGAHAGLDSGLGGAAQGAAPSVSAAVRGESGTGAAATAGAPTSPAVATAPAPDRHEVPEAGPSLGRATPARSAHGRIASAGSAVHQVSDPGQAFLGALVVDAADRDQATKVLIAAADTSRFAGWDCDPIDLALVALVRGQVPMSAVTSVGPVLRGGSEQERALVAGEIESVDETSLLLALPERADDGLYSRLVLRRMSRPVTSLALRLGLMPTLVSLIGLIVGLGAAACFAMGAWPASVAGAVLLQASLVLGRVHDELGRLARSSSALGAWLDAACKPVTEFAAYAGLAIGAARTGADLWLLATLLMALQTIRHVADRGFSQVARVRESWVSARPLLDTSDGAAPGSGETPLRLRAPRTRTRWAYGILRLPIGERWLVLGVGAVTVGPRWTFLVVLALGLAAWAYTTAERLLRSLRWRNPPELSGSWLLVPQLDLGPIGEPLWNRTLARLDPLARALGWAWPMAMRVVELGAVWWVVAHVAPDQASWLFVWTFVIALHHNDLLERVQAGSIPPRWLSWFGLGWDGRTILVLLAGWSGAGVLSGLLHVGAPLLAVLFVVVSPVQWIRFLNRRSRRVNRA